MSEKPAHHLYQMSVKMLASPAEPGSRKCVKCIVKAIAEI